MRRGRIWTAVTVLICLFVSAPSPRAEEPWRLADWSALPDWLHMSGEARIRYETLDGQFRTGGAGSDQVLALRALLFTEARFGRVAFGIELQDARTYLDDPGTPLSTSLVNPLDFLQGYVRLSLDGLFGDGVETDLQIGRFTMDIGSRRYVERNDFRNTINAFAGAYAQTRWGGQHELHTFYTVPVRREAGDREARGENDLEFDRHQTNRRFWAVHYQHGEVLPNLYADLFVYGLNEFDNETLETPNRTYVSPGFRLYYPPRKGSFDFDLDAAYRVGNRHATTARSDTTDLDVTAHFVHAEIGYTFDHPWAPRLVFDYHRASGDKDPNDGDFGQYERLFGTRRGDLGHTSIHGPLTRANLSAPGARFLLNNGRFDSRLAWKAAFLASATDVWTVARIRDPSGQSGRFIGHALDGRMRYWLIPGNLRAEIGGSLLLKGRFAREAPGVTGEENTLYGYGQLTSYF